MTAPKRAKVAADELRWYANHLRNVEGRLGALRTLLDDGWLPVDARGVHIYQGMELGVNRGIRGNLPDPEDQSMKEQFASDLLRNKTRGLHE